MVAPAIGEVVLVRFPFSDLSQTKLRPALCLAPVGRGDSILCQITSQGYGDPLAIALVSTDFLSGGLRQVSYARPGKLFTAHRSLGAACVGQLSDAAIRRVIDAILALLTKTKP